MNRFKVWIVTLVPGRGEQIVGRLVSKGLTVEALSKAHNKLEHYVEDHVGSIVGLQITCAHDKKQELLDVIEATMVELHVYSLATIVVLESDVSSQWQGGNTIRPKEPTVLFASPYKTPPKTDQN